MEIQGRQFQNGESLYSDWFSREGDNMLFRAQATSVATGGSLKLTFYTKNSDDAGDPSSAIIDPGTGTEYSVTVSDPTVNDGFNEVLISSSSVAANGIKELVRIKAECTGNWITARFFPPVFFDSAN